MDGWRYGEKPLKCRTMLLNRRALLWVKTLQKVLSDSSWGQTEKVSSQLIFHTYLILWEHLCINIYLFIYTPLIQCPYRMDVLGVSLQQWRTYWKVDGFVFSLNKYLLDDGKQDNLSSGSARTEWLIDTFYCNLTGTMLSHAWSMLQHTISSRPIPICSYIRGIVTLISEYRKYCCHFISAFCFSKTKQQISIPSFTRIKTLNPFRIKPYNSQILTWQQELVL